MRRYITLAILGLVALAGCKLNELVAPPLNDYKVHAYYVVPADKSFSESSASRVVGAILEMQRWYQTATGGITFEILDQENISEVYFAQHETAYYEGDWWSRLLNEMKSTGHPVESKGTIAMIWVEGMDQISENVVALASDMCDGGCGAAVMSINTLYGQTWPIADMGTPLHEMGHALGLKHPVEEADLPLAEADLPLLASVMCQSNVRSGGSTAEHGFLTNEKEALMQNPFLKKNVATNQGFWQTNIINYPVSGTVPEPTIEAVTRSFWTVQFTTNIDDALLYYWYFGDGSTSNEASPTHSYSYSGLYNVTLMVTDKNLMANRVSQFVQIE